MAALPLRAHKSYRYRMKGALWWLVLHLPLFYVCLMNAVCACFAHNIQLLGSSYINASVFLHFHPFLAFWLLLHACQIWACQLNPPVFSPPPNAEQLYFLYQACQVLDVPNTVVCELAVRQCGFLVLIQIFTVPVTDIMLLKI